MVNIDKFPKWFLISFVLGILGFVAVFLLEDLSRATGELNRIVLLVGSLTIFVLLLSSLLSIVKANSKRIRREIVISAIFSIIPISALVINGLLFTIYFVGK